MPRLLVSDYYTVKIVYTPNNKMFSVFSGFKDLNWKYLNPLELVKKLKENIPDGEAVQELLENSGITSGYQEKPCLNPNDDECPETAPNQVSKQVRPYSRLHPQFHSNLGPVILCSS